ncbi:MAG: tyrosine-type recombinase/integrase [Proteobacteria bacterium]|nr:tyrosine-type recombinase/integrase [Pseudomonadota bacterium]
MKKMFKGYRSILGKHISDFLSHKRAIGRRFDVEESALRLLDRFVNDKKVVRMEQITPELIESFMKSRPRQRPRSYNHLLCTIRRLFDWLVIHDSIPCSPVQIRSKRQNSERLPFIFDQNNARKLLAAARKLPDNPRAPMRGSTYYTIFAILYGLGLRVGEVCRLKISDLDFERKVLVIRKTKFYKDRLVPFGPKMAMLLENYLSSKIENGIFTEDEALFSFSRGREINPCTVSQVFHHLVPRLMLTVPPGRAAPRLHDLRHSFAVGTLLRWYRTGESPGAGLLQLSTFLGHVDTSSTSVYLRMTPELLSEANTKFERYASTALWGESI